MLEETMDTLEDQDELEEEAQEEVDKVSVILGFFLTSVTYIVKLKDVKPLIIIAHLHFCQKKQRYGESCFILLQAHHMQPSTWNSYFLCVSSNHGSNTSCNGQVILWIF
jgi:hypothetical protein